jgi:methylmalonyl-CoA mutase cobalamin-binding domain/chain
MAESLSQAMTDLNEEKVKELIKQEIKAGTPAIQILRECQKGMVEIGKKYEAGTYFVSELMYAGEIMKEITAELKPMLKGDSESEKKLGIVVIGTVKGDIHDLGKDIVALMLRGVGFEVIDLGVDVTPEKFVQAVKESGANIVGMSVFLTAVYESATATVNALKDAGLRDKVKIMIGGGPVTELVRQSTGCDFYGKDAAAGVDFALRMTGAK